MIETIIPEPIEDYNTMDYVNDIFRYLVISVTMIVGVIGLLWLVWAV